MLGRSVTITTSTARQQCVMVTTMKTIMRRTVRTWTAKQVVGLVGIKEDRNSSFLRGAAKAPDVIRSYFKEAAVNTFCEYGLDVDLAIRDYGDLTPPSNDSETLLKMLTPYISLIMENDGLMPLFLGGDHSITHPITRAIRSHVGQPLVIVHFDAHGDIYPDYEGNKNSHACPFARICETPDLCRQLIQVGIRTLSGPQFSQIEKYGVRVISAKDFPAKGGDIVSILREYIPDASTPVYLSFDLDCLDPSCAPGVSHREAGGLTSRQAIDAIHCIPGRIVGADLVEYNPDRDTHDFVTASTAAKIMKEIAGKMVVSNRSVK